MSEAPSDEALLGGMAEGDHSSAVTFVRRYQKRVFGLAMALLGDAGAAEDVAQEALMRAWRHASVFDARRGSVAAWILTITRNLAVDALRLRRAVPTDPDTLLGAGLASTEHPTDEQAERAELRAPLHAALADLPDGQRRALVLAAVYGFSAAEIGHHEQIPLGTAKTRIRTAMAKVRAAVAAEEPMP